MEVKRSREGIAIDKTRQVAYLNARRRIAKIAHGQLICLCANSVGNAP
jgi:hypothetical protein